MKYEINQEDKRRIESFERNDPIIKFCKNKESFRFNLGDVLIKKYYAGKHIKGPWVTEQVSGTIEAPKKYIYVYEDDQGIGYIKQILSNGKLSDIIVPMTNFDAERDKFELDPDYADHIMLADEGDVYKPNLAQQAKKKFREQAYKANKKLLVPINTCKAKYDFLKSLSVGDTFWLGYNMDGMSETKVEVVDVNEKDAKDITDRWKKQRYFDVWLKNEPELIGLKFITVKFKPLITSNNSYYSINSTYDLEIDFSERFISKVQPQKMKENI